jgi:hypothetical protein
VTDGGGCHGIFIAVAVNRSLCCKACCGLLQVALVQEVAGAEGGTLQGANKFEADSLMAASLCASALHTCTVRVQYTAAAWVSNVHAGVRYTVMLT